tara:strand:- start:2449 stop:3006 length:558 start_codon:yes stop_codon:yes gene_type:complete
MAVRGYFANIPSIEYATKIARNLITRPIIKNKILNNPNIIYDYVVKDGERPDIIANAYYGNVNYTWLIFLANDIVDPYYDWPLTSEQLNNLVIDKYGSIEAAQDTTSTTNIVHYKHNTKGTIISKDTFDTGLQSWSKIVQGQYTAVRQYDFEVEKNEAKRSIKLVDNRVSGSAFELLREAMLENG